MPDGNKKVAERSAEGLSKNVTFLLPPGIKGLMHGNRVSTKEFGFQLCDVKETKWVYVFLWWGIELFH